MGTPVAVSARRGDTHEVSGHSRTRKRRCGVTRPLTRQQYERLRCLGAGGFVVAPRRRGWEPLLRRGLVRIPELHGDHHGESWAAFLGITSDGYRALAAASERYGLPELPHRDPGSVRA